MKNFYLLPAPAKLNLFLHVVGRREDGMHLLETVFQLIDLCDYLSFEELDSNTIEREGDINWDLNSDLCFKAAKLLHRFAPQRGVRIIVEKRIPWGAGLGGGSSDAATCLLALNRLWNLSLSRSQLIQLASQLGADVPFFVFGQTAFAEATGNVLSPINVDEKRCLLIHPEVEISTKQIFSSFDLTTGSKHVKISNLSKLMKDFWISPYGQNDLEPVASKSFPQVELAIQLLRKIGHPRMTGSGSAVFCAMDKGFEGLASFYKEFPAKWKHWEVNTISKHPLLSWV